MKKIGIYMAIFGAGSILLNLVGMEFKLLMWIDLWGPAIGWAIRIGLIVVGVAIAALVPSGESETGQGGN